MNLAKTDYLISDKAFKARVQENMNRFRFRARSRGDRKMAAVAVTIVDVGEDSGIYGIDVSEISKGEGALLLTRRGSRLNSHAGQWAFPGGRMDHGETPEETALRELEEEVGLSLTRHHVIGRLDDYATHSGYVISPVVIWGGRVERLTPNPGEVESIHRIPIREFLREDAPILESASNPANPVLLMPVGNSWIASPTGAIIYQFREVAILGKETRVAHFEQPYFAWS